MLHWNNLDTLTAFEKLKAKKGSVNLPEAMAGESGAQRVAKYTVPMACGLAYNYAAKAVDDELLSILKELAQEAQLEEKYAALYNGEMINTGEKRLVLHQLTRGQLGDAVVVDGVDKRAFYAGEQKKAAEFAQKVHAGEIANADGEKFTTVVQIGIGGSDLGPRAMYLALENWAKENGACRLEARFISNVDPDDAANVLKSIDLPHSLFVLVSKSGTTLETLTNETFVKNALRDAGLDPSKHMVAVTSETSPLAKSDEYLAAFFMDDFIGGRYSSTSCVGGVVLSLAFGPEVFARFLAGAHAADLTAKESDPLKNPSMLDALIGVYERNVLGYPVTAVLPYSQALSRFPAHLQQLDPIRKRSAASLRTCSSSIWSPTASTSTASARRSLIPPDLSSSASRAPTASIRSISSCIRARTSFRCSSSASAGIRRAWTRTFRAAPASKSCAPTWPRRSWLLPAASRTRIPTRALRAVVPPASSSVNSLRRNPSARCWRTLRIR